MIAAAFLLLVNGAAVSKASIAPNLAVEKAILEFRLDEAWYALDQEPKAELKEYYKCRIMFARLLATENPQYAITLKNLADHAIEVYKGMSPADPMRGVFIAETHLLKGIAAIQRNDFVNGGWELNNACRLIQKNAEIFPNEKANLKLTGLFHVALGTLPKKWDWVGKFLCTSGETNGGILELETSAAAGGLLPWESSLILHFLHKSLLNKPELALGIIESLREKHGPTIVLDFILAGMYQGQRRNVQAMGILVTGEQYRSNSKIQFIPYWDFYLGLSQAYIQNNSEAENHFATFLSEYKGKTFRADATFRKAMMESLNGNAAGAKKLFASVALLPVSNHEADEYAMFVSRIFNETPPGEIEKNLYRARNLFDGGFYQQSINMLTPLAENANSLSDDQATELNYRIGRNHQEMYNPALARIYYNACLRFSPSHNLWMKVYCHYYMGKIYQSENNKAEAERYYRLALTFSGYLYEAGLQQKCKSALNSLKNQ
jgi:tetratricopeptide (TPR) repeat protein